MLHLEDTLAHLKQRSVVRPADIVCNRDPLHALDRRNARGRGFVAIEPWHAGADVLVVGAVAVEVVEKSRLQRVVVLRGDRARRARPPTEPRTARRVVFFARRRRGAVPEERRGAALCGRFAGDGDRSSVFLSTQQRRHVEWVRRRDWGTCRTGDVECEGSLLGDDLVDLECPVEWPALV